MRFGLISEFGQTRVVMRCECGSEVTQEWAIVASEKISVISRCSLCGNSQILMISGLKGKIYKEAMVQPGIGGD